MINEKIVVQRAWRGSIIGVLIFLAIYVAILTLSMSFSYAIEQFIDMWKWFIPLTLGFTMQLWLFIYTRNAAMLKAQQLSLNGTMAASGGVSTTSMVACCAHHLADVLPLLGFSAAAIFLTKYQNIFLLMGILSSIVGIFFMLKNIQKHNLYFKNRSFLNFIMKNYNLNKGFYLSVVLGVMIFSVSLIEVFIK